MRSIHHRNRAVSVKEKTNKEQTQQEAYLYNCINLSIYTGHIHTWRLSVRKHQSISALNDGGIDISKFWNLENLYHLTPKSFNFTLIKFSVYSSFHHTGYAIQTSMAAWLHHSLDDGFLLQIALSLV